MGTYDIIQAIPHAAATLQEMNYNITILSSEQTDKKQTINAVTQAYKAHKR